MLSRSSTSKVIASIWIIFAILLLQVSDVQVPFLHNMSQQASAAVAVSRISMNIKTIELLEGESQVLKATITPSNAANKKITWSSSNSKIAAVSSTGKVKAIRGGNAVITAKSSNGKKALCKVTVKKAVIDVESILLDYSDIQMDVDETLTITATVLPSNATDKEINWSSDDESIVFIDSDGMLLPISEGMAVVTAISNNGIEASCMVTVTDDITEYIDSEEQVTEDIIEDIESVDHATELDIEPSPEIVTPKPTVTSTPTITPKPSAIPTPKPTVTPTPTPTPRPTATPIPTPTTAPTPTPKEIVAYVCNTEGAGLWVRDQGSSSGNKVGSFAEGQQITVIGDISNGWYQVKGTDKNNGATISGYSYGDYITFTNNTTANLGYITGEQIDTTIQWAESRLGSQSYNYYCLKFVGEAFRSAGVGNKGYSYATQAGDAIITNSDTNPPRGAVVFYNWYGTIDGDYRNWGHVGISLGNGKVISADYNGVKITNLYIDNNRTYRGWGIWK